MLNDLQPGDWFRSPRYPGQVFKFLATRVDARGQQYISAFGGSRNPEGNNAFRAFYTDIPIKKIKKVR